MRYIHIKLNEYLSNNKHIQVKWIFTSILDELNRNNFDISDQRYNDSFAEFYISGENIDTKKINKIIDKWNENTMVKDNIIVSYRSENYNEYTKYELYFKEVKIKRIKPNRYVYHQTDSSNIEHIIVNGLTTKDSSNWISSDYTLKYPNAIFASNSETDLFYKDEDDDISTIRIDTFMIPNKWWLDLNLYTRKNYIMTFDDIPASAITIL
jgi:hypothetical protein